jgi:Ca-activated chloride channel family protein
LLYIFTFRRANDLKPNRLERARRKIVDLLPLLHGERLGLVAFAGQSHILCPLTLDYEALTIFLNYLDTDLIPIQGTNLAEAIQTALSSFEKQTRSSRNILLITDGEDHQEGLDDAIAAAKKAEVKIFVVGIGSPEGAPIPALDGGGFRKDSAGNVILTRLNEGQLQKIASETGGRYARSVVGDLDLETVYFNGIRNQTKDTSNPDKPQEKRKQLFTERYQLFLLPGLMLLLLALFLPERRRTKPQNLSKAAAWWFVVGIIAVANFLSPAKLYAGPLSRGVKKYQAEKYPEALQSFTEGQVDDPENPMIHYNLGNNYYRLKRFDEAGKEFEQALKNSDKKIAPEKRQYFEQDTHYNLGNSYFGQKKYQPAIEHYESALKINPQDQDAKFNLELAKKLLEEQKQQQKEQDKKDPQDPSEANKEKQSPDQKTSENKEQPQSEQQNPAQQKPAQQKDDPNQQEAKMWLSQVEENGKEALKESLRMQMRKQRDNVSDKDW